MSSKLPINLEDLLRQRKVEGDRIEYKRGWNPDPIMRTLCAFANDFENLGGDFLKELDLTEGRSTGISKILKVIKENGSPPPEFETDNDRSYFLTRLPVHEDAVVVETPVEMPVKTPGKTSGKTSGKTPDRILRVLGENPRMTLAEVAEVIGKSVSAVERASSQLVKTEHLKYIGPQKGGHWVVKKKP